jgi:imidazolonepropionase-like amidohydrolase
MHSLKPWEAAGTSGGGACVLDARIIDGMGGDPIERGYITIVNGRVARVGTMAKLDFEVGRDLERFDVEGRTIIPGLIDAHAHLVYGGYRRFDELNSVGPEAAAIHAAANAWTVLRAGYTTIRDLGTVANAAVAVRDAIEIGRVAGPRVVASGRFITSSRGPIQHPAVPWAGGMTVVADGPSAMTRAVRDQVALGVDNIKLMASGIEAHMRVGTETDTLTEAEIAAAVDEAHLAGRTVAVHAQSTAAIKFALRAGADTIEHGTRIDDEAIELFLRGNTVLVPTLSTLFSVLEYGERYDLLPKQRAEMAVNEPLWLDSFRAALAAGIPMAAGGDVGNRYPHGANAREIELLAQHGMTPMEALRAATGGAAIALRREAEIGSLQPGRHADLVVLERDPLDDLSTLLDMNAIRLVVKGGKPVAGTLFDRPEAGLMPPG